VVSNAYWDAAVAAQKVKARGQRSVRINRDDTDGAWVAKRPDQPEGEQRHVKVAGDADLERETGAPVLEGAELLKYRAAGLLGLDMAEVQAFL
jgi:hypothetical protein